MVAEVRLWSEGYKPRTEIVSPGQSATFNGPKGEKVVVNCVESNVQTTVIIAPLIGSERKHWYDWVMLRSYPIYGEEEKVILKRKQTRTLWGGGTMSMESMSITHS